MKRYFVASLVVLAVISLAVFGIGLNVKAFTKSDEKDTSKSNILYLEKEAEDGTISGCAEIDTDVRGWGDYEKVEYVGRGKWIYGVKNDTLFTIYYNDYYDHRTSCKGFYYEKSNWKAPKYRAAVTIRKAFDGEGPNQTWYDYDPNNNKNGDTWDDFDPTGH